MSARHHRFTQLAGVAAAATAAIAISTATAYAEPAVPQAGATDASTTINALTSSGFDVQVNWLEGHPNVPLSECKVDAIHNPNGPMASVVMLSTVYVDVACPNAK